MGDDSHIDKLQRFLECKLEEYCRDVAKNTLDLFGLMDYLYADKGQAEKLKKKEEQKSDKQKKADLDGIEGVIQKASRSMQDVKSIADFGPGSGLKTRNVISFLGNQKTPISTVYLFDSSDPMLDVAKETLMGGGVDKNRILTDRLDWTERWDLKFRKEDPQKRLYLLLGQTIGNFQAPNSVAVKIASNMNVDDLLMVECYDAPTSYYVGFEEYHKECLDRVFEIPQEALGSFEVSREYEDSKGRFRASEEDKKRVGNGKVWNTMSFMVDDVPEEQRTVKNKKTGETYVLRPGTRVIVGRSRVFDDNKEIVNIFERGTGLEAVVLGEGAKSKVDDQQKKQEKGIKKYLLLRKKREPRSYVGLAFGLSTLTFLATLAVGYFYMEHRPVECVNGKVAGITLECVQDNQQPMTFEFSDMKEVDAKEANNKLIATATVNGMKYEFEVEGKKGIEGFRRARQEVVTVESIIKETLRLRENPPVPKYEDYKKEDNPNFIFYQEEKVDMETVVMFVHDNGGGLGRCTRLLHFMEESTRTYGLKVAQRSMVYHLLRRIKKGEYGAFDFLLKKFEDPLFLRAQQRIEELRDYVEERVDSNESNQPIVVVGNGQSIVYPVPKTTSQIERLMGLRNVIQSRNIIISNIPYEGHVTSGGEYVIIGEGDEKIMYRDPQPNRPLLAADFYWLTVKLVAELGEATGDISQYVGNLIALHGVVSERIRNRLNKPGEDVTEDVERLFLVRDAYQVVTLAPRIDQETLSHYFAFLNDIKERGDAPQISALVRKGIVGAVAHDVSSANPFIYSVQDIIRSDNAWLIKDLVENDFELLGRLEKAAVTGRHDYSFFVYSGKIFEWFTFPCINDRFRDITDKDKRKEFAMEIFGRFKEGHPLQPREWFRAQPFGDPCKHYLQDY